MTVISPVVVGAGPAGIRAVEALVKGGLRPTLLDEAILPGGQIYRQQPSNFSRSSSKLYGSEHKKADRLHQLMKELAPHVNYFPGTMVWNAEDGKLDCVREGKAESLAFSHLVVATGATDRVLPFEGWTLPGVYSLGASQIALKFQATAIGKRIVFVGTGPLLYLVAYQYVRAGVKVEAVLDTSSLRNHAAAIPGLLRMPSLFVKGLRYMAHLRARGVTLMTNVRPVRAEGDDRVAAVSVRDLGKEKVVRIECDAIGYGLGLRSETQLASILGCEFAFNERDRAWLPVRSTSLRSSVKNVYLAGDGAGIMGADAAELSGERAALALLEDVGQRVDRLRSSELESALSKISMYRETLERAFPFPHDIAQATDDSVVVCRCEEISAGAIRSAASDKSVVELNRLKALTRVGMGRCQGRMCGAAAAELLASHTGQTVQSVGRIRIQPPIKPIAFAASRFKSFTEAEEVK